MPAMGSAVLLDLGDRYWALGLPAAARSVLARALAAGDDATPALRLTEIALAQGDTAAARKFAAEAAKRSPGPATKILLGRAQLAAGELAAARMSLLAALDAPKLGGVDRARVHLELSRAASGIGDAAGAAAQAGAAFDAALDIARGGTEPERAGPRSGHDPASGNEPERAGPRSGHDPASGDTPERAG